MKISPISRFLFIWIGGVWIPLLAGGQSAAPAFLPTHSEDYCQLKGAVFVETAASFADYRVFVEEVEDFADLRVFRENVGAFAKESGHWYLTQVKSHSDFTVAWVPIKSSADFSVCFTKQPSLAGCQRR
jgi:hypothetical protein